MTEYLTVSTLTKYLKAKFDRDPYLERVYLTGEISNFRQRPSHQYFAIKDEKSVIQATMWAGQFKKLDFKLEDGMKVLVTGRISLYHLQVLILLILKILCLMALALWQLSLNN